MSDSSIYVAGGATSFATLWDRNGNILWQESNSSYANSVYILDNAVYVAGLVHASDTTLATLWDGSGNILWLESESSSASSCFVKQ